jgi:hypothetical protein
MKAAYSAASSASLYKVSAVPSSKDYLTSLNLLVSLANISGLAKSAN